MYNQEDIRCLLIATYYSDEEAKNFFLERLNDRDLLDVLIKVALDEGDYNGDGPMAAGDYIHKFSSKWLKEYEEILLTILYRENYSSVRPEDIAMALASFKSPKAKSFILDNINELGEGPRFESFKEALKKYEA